MLSYNDGNVYYAFHRDFQDDFVRVAKEWCRHLDVRFIGHPELLDDKDYEPTPQELDNTGIGPRELSNLSDDGMSPGPQSSRPAFHPGWNQRHPEPHQVRHEKRSKMQRLKVIVGLGSDETQNGSSQDGRT
jgi:hypothetical protein